MSGKRPTRPGDGTWVSITDIHHRNASYPSTTITGSIEVPTASMKLSFTSGLTEAEHQELSDFMIRVTQRIAVGLSEGFTLDK